MILRKLTTGVAGGYLAGLLTGVTVCAGIALYVTNAPVPFVSKVQRATDNIQPEAVDPNQPLFSPQIPAAQPAAPAAAGTAEAPAANSDAAAAAPVAAPAPPRDDPPARQLQVGAFHSADDADALRARLALLGLDAQVSQVTGGDGATVYRVRLGPYGPNDDVNAIRKSLSENGFEAQEVHAR